MEVTKCLVVLSPNQLSYVVAIENVFKFVNFFLQISFNPQDNTQLCVVGQGIFKLFRYNEGNLKQFAFQKSELHRNYLCHAWVSDERIVVGTDNGKILLFELGELKAEFSVNGSNTPVGGSSSNVGIR